MSGNDLFVTYVNDQGAYTVGEYDATTGAAIDSNLITGLDYVGALAVVEDYLFVNTFNRGLVSTVGKYDAATGGTINANFITGLALLGAHGNAFYGAASNHYLSKFDASTGAVIDRTFIRVDEPTALAWLANRLFVEKPDYNSFSIRDYDAATGTVINNNFITKIQFPTGGLAAKSTK